MGGIICQSHYNGRAFDVTIGIGINISNKKPTICMDEIASKLQKKEVALGRSTVLASFCNQFTEAINTFRADKSIKLATYASKCIENEILMFIRKTAGLRQEVSIDEPLNVDKDGNELLLSDILGNEEDSVFSSIELEEDRRTVRQALERLDRRERIIIELRFGLDGGKEHTQKEVADMLGISQSYISRLEKKILDRLKEEMKELV